MSRARATTLSIGAMNGVRLAITAFIVVLIITATAGFIWVGSHQTAAQAVASRTVLVLSVVAGLIGMRNLWRSR
jgi:hypothetical protein